MDGKTLALRSILGSLLCLWMAACGSSPDTAKCVGTKCDDQSADGTDSDDDDDATDDEVPVAKDAGKSSPTPARDAGTQATKPTAEVPKANGDLPCDVKAIVDQYCGTCHGAKPSAPMSLVTLADFQASTKEGKKYVDLVKTFINAKVASERMPPASVDQLPAATLATLNAWLDKGAPAGTALCAATPATPEQTGDGADIDVSGLECTKFLSRTSATDASKFKLGVQRDGYFNVTFTAPWKETVYGMVVRPVIDNRAVLHHWLLFQTDAAAQPTGAVKSSGAHPGGQLLHGWAPGGEALDTRAAGDVGIELPATSYTVEFHYNSSDANAEDASGVEVCYQKKKPANIAGLSWLGFDQLGIPSTEWTGNCAPQAKTPIKIFGLSPHMHKTGLRMTSIINRKDGTKETLHDKDFDFEFQVSYRKDVMLYPGDTITTTCKFSQPMTFGESTGSEMCYLFTMAYPKGALASPDVWGSLTHGGSSCLGM